MMRVSSLVSIPGSCVCVFLLGLLCLYHAPASLGVGECLQHPPQFVIEGCHFRIEGSRESSVFGIVIPGRTVKPAHPSGMDSAYLLWGGSPGRGWRQGESVRSSQLCARRCDKKQNSVGRSTTLSPTHSTPTSMKSWPLSKESALDRGPGVLFLLPFPSIFAFLKTAVLSGSLSVQVCLRR